MAIVAGLSNWHCVHIGRNGIGNIFAIYILTTKVTEELQQHRVLCRQQGQAEKQREGAFLKMTHLLQVMSCVH